MVKKLFIYICNYQAFQFPLANHSFPATLSSFLASISFYFSAISIPNYAAKSAPEASELVYTDVVSSTSGGGVETCVAAYSFISVVALALRPNIN